MDICGDSSQMEPFVSVVGRRTTHFNPNFQPKVAKYSARNEIANPIWKIKIVAFACFTAGSDRDSLFAIMKSNNFPQNSFTENHFVEIKRFRN